MLEQLLNAWGMTYEDFASVIGVDHRSLWRYRKGQRQFKLSTIEIKRLEKLLAKIGLRFKDLPDDWIVERLEEPEKISA